MSKYQNLGVLPEKVASQVEEEVRKILDSDEALYFYQGFASSVYAPYIGDTDEFNQFFKDKGWSALQVALNVMPGCPGNPDYFVFDDLEHIYLISKENLKRFAEPYIDEIVDEILEDLHYDCCPPFGELEEILSEVNSMGYYDM